MNDADPDVVSHVTPALVALSRDACRDQTDAPHFLRIRCTRLLTYGASQRPPGACGRLAMHGADVGVVAHAMPTLAVLWRDLCGYKKNAPICTLSCRTAWRMPGTLQRPAANAAGSHSLART